MAKYTINRRNAILETQKMWKLIADSGLSKTDWLYTEAAKP
jgi:hypothetical protein